MKATYLRRTPAIFGLLNEATLHRVFSSSARNGNTAYRWICRDCLISAKQNNQVTTRRIPSIPVYGQQLFSTATRYGEQVKQPDLASQDAAVTSNRNDEAVPAPKSRHALLPSQTDQQRWHMSKRMSRVMDQILARASVASQQINAYTGTDYSGIETLRKEIVEQERVVRERNQRVEAARSQHRDAHSKQAASQKEIVALLERKSSWSPGDLERYMSLVRSEHTDEQAVQHAKEGLALAERELETSRSALERLERKQYHEEQIWSDTIRRNSTWVTFGLMGVNIVLLLAQIAIFEPYRRRKIVREVQRALEEKTVHPTSATQLGPVGHAREPYEITESNPQAEDQAQQTEAVQLQPLVISKDEPDVTLDASGAHVPAPDVADQLLPEPVEVIAHDIAAPMTAVGPDNQPNSKVDSWLQSFAGTARDLFSERIVEMRKIDVTSMTMTGAATGAIVGASLVFLLRSN